MKFFKKIIIAILTCGHLRLKAHASILMYHAVDKDNRFLTTSPGSLLKQLEYLSRRRDITIVHVSELVRRLQAGESVAGLVSVTFDDGLENFYTIAWPLLEKYNVPATVFTCEGLMGKSFHTSDGATWPVMSEAMVREIARDGLIEFLSHTYSHPDLSVLSPESYDKEIGREGTILAYPKGRFSSEVVEYLKRNGWLAAVGVKGGLVDEASDVYDLPRNGVGPETSIKHFALLVSDRLNLFLKIKKLSML